MSTSQILRIRDWDELYESSATLARPRDPLPWVKIPTKLGTGYHRLVTHRRGSSHFGAWLGIVQTAAKCFPRGVLVSSDGRPLGPLDLSRATRLPSRDFEEVIPRLLSGEDVGWLEVITPEACELLRTQALAHARPLAARTLDRTNARGNTRQQETTRDKKEQGASAGAEGAPPPSPAKSRKPSNPIDDEWLDGLQKDYPHLDVRFVYRKMYRWCEVHNKIASRKRMINWVNSEDKPMDPPSGTRPPGVTPPSIRPRKVIGG